jgi:hypothetical protein
MLVVDVSETSVKILATGKVSFAAGRLRNLITWDAQEIGCMRWRRSLFPVLFSNGREDQKGFRR